MNVVRDVLLSRAAWALAATILIGPAAAQADGKDMPIVFELVRAADASDCPDRDTLAARVAERLSQAHPAARLPVAERVSIAIARTSGGYRATVSALGLEGGVRHLVDKGNDCAGLAEALVLTLTMIADGRPAPRTVQDLPVHRQPRYWEAGAGVVGSTAILGKPSLGLALDGTWHLWPRLAAGVSALWFPNRSYDDEHGSTRFMLVAGLARLCAGALPFGARAFPALCATAGAGAVRGAGEGYTDARSVWVPWLAAGGSVDLSLRIHGRFSVVGRAGYLFSLRKDSFSIEPTGTVYDTGRSGFTAELGAGVQIP
jgi:hypothetical protein